MCCTGEWWWWADPDRLSSDGLNKSCQRSGAVRQRRWMCSQVRLSFSFGKSKSSLLCTQITVMHEIWWSAFEKPLCNCMQTPSPLLAKTAIFWCDLLHFMANCCQITCPNGSIMRRRGLHESLYKMHNPWILSHDTKRLLQNWSCKLQTPKLQNQQPKITFRNIKQRWLLYSGSSRKNWATFQSMTRACLMCGQTFRYVAFCYVFWQRQAEQHALQNLSNADSSLCLVSHPCYLFAACIRV